MNNVSNDGIDVKNGDCINAYTINVNNNFTAPPNAECKINNNEEVALKNNFMNKKDILYATPLRKTDRHNSSYRKSSGLNEEKIENIRKQQMNERELQNLMDRTYLNSELGENRIKDFLNDTAHLHKKLVEPSGKEHMGSSFSHLARKEHFLNLVHQNVLKNQETNCKVDVGVEEDLINLDESFEPNGDLEKTEKLINKLVNFQNNTAEQSLKSQSIFSPSLTRSTVTCSNVSTYLNREWVLKKIAMSLEQKTYKKLPPSLPVSEFAVASQQQTIQNSNLPLIGYLVLGSNGSGKTTICNDIIKGNNGTKGLLNRRLFTFYLINSQNPNCHSLSTFIRNMSLQILSFSSYWNTNETECNENTGGGSGVNEEVVDKELEEIIKNEIKINESNKKIFRQQSAPENNLSWGKKDNHKAFQKQQSETSLTKQEKKSSSIKKVSKIPVKIWQKGLISPVHVPFPNTTLSNTQEGGNSPSAITDIVDQKLEDDIANELRESMDDEESEHNKDTVESISERPSPLPREKDCRTLLADAYYNEMAQNPEIFESLLIDNIEKDPDDCFKKAILFPLLELPAPKYALLMLVDSIDENYLNDGILITTLKGKNAKSRNIAELLSNHIHLLPKWLFLVCTAKKQNKHIVKLFSGFKKLTLDDLRKSHVVKDVQQYIINRLNADFRGINLNKEIIDSLNQLYIKSNGCILYLRKVLNGIKDNFFNFREIKLIPCTLYGLFLYICQKSFNKKQYIKIRPILNILLACSAPVHKDFVFNCLKTQNYTIDNEDFERRLIIMKNILEIDEKRGTIKIFHNSFCEWLIDVKFSTKKFLCDINEGHLMIAMYYTLISTELCPNRVRDYIYHLTNTAEYMASKKLKLDVLMILLESKANLNECFYTNFLYCCKDCKRSFEFDINHSNRTIKMIILHLNGQIGASDFSSFIKDFFKPSLPADAKVLKVLMETGINNLETHMSYKTANANSSLISNISQTNDSELNDPLIFNEKNCVAEQKVKNVDLLANNPLCSSDGPCERLDAEIHKGKAFIHILSNEGNYVMIERALRACNGRVDLEIEDHNGQTALNIAARNGHLEVVKILLSYEWVS